MLMLTDSNRLTDDVLETPAIHVFCLGFEERCLSYPRHLAGLEPPRSHLLYALDPGNEDVNWLLKERRSDYWQEMRQLFPSCNRIDINGLEDITSSREMPKTFVFDFSSLPRRIILDILNNLASLQEEDLRILITYSYPEDYSDTALQVPSSEFSLFFDDSPIPKRRSSLLVLPGFERSYVTIARAHVSASSGYDPELRLIFPFPGRRYSFYQRGLEAHFDLIDENDLVLFPQDQLLLSYDIILREILRCRERPVLLLPLGPRTSLVPTFLAAQVVRKSTDFSGTNILFISTRRYSAVRSSGADVPLIEEIPVDLLKGKR